MRIFVSARLQATAAPDAPEPMISTSTVSFIAPLPHRSHHNRCAPTTSTPRRSDHVARPLDIFQHTVVRHQQYFVESDIGEALEALPRLLRRTDQRGRNFGERGRFRPVAEIYRDV